MKKALKEAWLSALRSGEYKQGRHGLYDSKEYIDKPIEDAECFCCIGVLARTQDMKGYLDTSDVVSIFGLYEYRDELIKMNDNQRKTFPKIADWIEANIRTED